MSNVKKIIAVLFITRLILISSVYSQTKYSYWISTEYINCLNKNLPCQCSDVASEYSFAITENNQGKIKTFWNKNINENEIDEYRIIKCDLKTNTFTTSLGNITLNKKTLILRTKNNHIVKYIHFKNANIYNENYNSIKTLELINKRIVSKNKNSIFDFVPVNSICNCNNELGKINIITQTGNGKSWVLEMRDDENKIILYKVSDDEMGKTMNPILNKKFLYSFLY